MGNGYAVLWIGLEQVVDLFRLRNEVNLEAYVSQLQSLRLLDDAFQNLLLAVVDNLDRTAIECDHTFAQFFDQRLLLDLVERRVFEPL